MRLHQSLRSVVRRTPCEGVSVIIPAFNAAAFLAPAIESILRQTYRHFEIIIVDDGSRDGTAAIAREYASDHVNIRAYSIPHAGISVAMNYGVSRARYDWIAVMHADDIAMPRRLEKQLRAARENPDVVVWGSYAVHISRSGAEMSLSATGPTTVEAFEERRRSRRPVLVVHSSAMIRRDALFQVGGYDPRFETSEDLDLFDRLSDVGPIVAIPEPLVQRRIHESCNTMRTYSRMHLMTRFVSERRRRKDEEGVDLDLEAYIASEAAQRLRRRIRTWVTETSQYHYHCAGIHFGSKNFALAAGHFISSACLDPRYAVLRAWNQLASFHLRRSQSNAYALLENSVTPAPIYEAA